MTVFGASVLMAIVFLSDLWSTPRLDVPDIATLETSHLRTSLESSDGRQSAIWENGRCATIVNFWATWCRPCTTELPLFESLHKARSNARVVLVNTDLSSTQSLGRYLSTHGLTLTSLLDRESQVFHLLGLHVLPTTLVLDRDGALVNAYQGSIDPKAIELDIEKICPGGTG